MGRMARLARVVVPGVAHHVTQRGNRRERVFFEADDYVAYLALISGAAKASGTEIWGYCLMPNHVHFLMVPNHKDGLRSTFAQAHRRYTGRIHARHQWTGHLWQGRFSSTAMDEAHLYAAIRYVDLNPVRAGLAAQASDWPWSSARAHIAGRDDGVVTVGPVIERVGDFPPTSPRRRTPTASQPSAGRAPPAGRREPRTGSKPSNAISGGRSFLAREAPSPRASPATKRICSVQCHRNPARTGDQDHLGSSIPEDGD